MNRRIKSIVTALKPRDRVKEILDDMDRSAVKITQVTGPVCQNCGSDNVVYQIHYELPKAEE